MENTQPAQPLDGMAKNLPKINLILYAILGLLLLVSFLVDTIVPFVIGLFGFVGIDYLIKIQIKKKTRVTIEPTPVQQSKSNRLIGKICAGLIIVSFILTLALGEMLIFLICTVIAFIITLYVRTIRQKTSNISDTQGSKYERWEWVDQFRGLVVVFLVIAAITWILSGGHINGVGDPNNPPIGPTYLNHGWKFAEFNGWPNIITLIDLGQQILMFIVGFVGALAYYHHREKEGELGAFIHILRRFTALMFFAMLVDELFDGNLIISDWNLVSVFWTGTFPNLAWGSLIGLIAVMVLKHKPNQRCLIAAVIMICYSVMFAIPELQTWAWMDGNRKIFEIPWNTINHVAIAIFGTCTYDWYMMKTKENPEFGWTKRILPIGTVCFIFAWLVNYIEPAEHHDATTALALMAIATSQFILFIFYSFDKFGFKISPLSTMGKNILIMFLITGYWDPYFDIFEKAALVANPWLALVVVGVIPIVFQWLVAWILDQNKIIIKF